MNYCMYCEKEIEGEGFEETGCCDEGCYWGYTDDLDWMSREGEDGLE